MTPETRPQIEVSTAIGNFFDKSHPAPVLWTVGRFVRAAEESGYAGLEWHPLRIPSSFLLKRGFASQHSKDRITSLHQSYRSEKNFTEAWNHPNRQLAVVSYFLLPERVDSLKDLQKFQEAVGRKLPVVLYATLPGEESGTDRPFGEKLFQPTPEVMEMWGVQSAEQMVEEGYRRGYTGLCLDLFHFRETGEVDLNPWQESLPKLLEHTKEIHVSAGRDDVKVAHGVDTDAELGDLVMGTSKTDLTRILQAVKDLGWSGYVVTEIPAASIRQHNIRGGAIMLTSDLVESHKQVVDTIKGVLS